MKKFYSVEIEATGWTDDLFCADTYEECEAYINENYADDRSARIVEFNDYGDDTEAVNITWVNGGSDEEFFGN